MKDKTQYEALMEELQQIVENFRVGVTEIGERFAKLLPDIEIPEEEEDTWEMKCPYSKDDEYWFIYSYGDIDSAIWFDSLEDNRRLKLGNAFPTEEAAELEAKRRYLLTRFKAFRDECNGDWKPDWSNYEHKWAIYYKEKEFTPLWSYESNSFQTFGYFKYEQDAQRAIDLFGDEIKELFVECD